MARAQSPGYPNMSLPKAISAVKKIFAADRRNPIAREVAVKHIGYAGPSGAADKALGSLAHYGLTEKTGKGEVRVSQLAVDIIHPEKPQDRAKAILRAAFNPQIFKELRQRFSDGQVSEEALKSYLIRENFLDRAVGAVAQSYFDTCRYLEQEGVSVSISESSQSDEKDLDEGDDKSKFGGAKVGDLVQWEVDGVLQLEKPLRVRQVSDDGAWIAVDGSETGLPMSQVIVEQRAGNQDKPPVFKIPERISALKLESSETEWMRNLVGRETSVRLLVSGGEMGPKEIGRLIKLLEAQKAVLSDDDEPSEE